MQHAWRVVCAPPEMGHLEMKTSLASIYNTQEVPAVFEPLTRILIERGLEPARMSSMHGHCCATGRAEGWSGRTVGARLRSNHGVASMGAVKPLTQCQNDVVYIS